MPQNKLSSILLLLFVFVLQYGFAQRDIPPRPSNQTSVYDDADVLSASEEQQLERKLINYADTTSTQIVVATINSLNGEYIGTYGADWADEWGIGQADKDNGMLILLAKEDRQIWIETGYGLEEYMTDYRSKEIIESIILPEFRNNNYYAGLDQGTTAIFQVLEGTFEGSRSSEPNPIPFSVIIMFIIFVVILISLARTNRRDGGNGPGGRRMGGGSLLDIIVLSSLGRGGFGGGSGGGFGGGGGGFGGGFGGGGFGGGGAGGSW